MSGLYDDLIPRTEDITPSLKASASMYSDLIPKAKPQAVKAPSLYHDLTPKLSPKEDSYWSGVINGVNYAPSKTLDTSGKPLLDYRGFKDLATTTDKTRVDVKFDPSVAQKLDPKSFYNDRAISNRAQLKAKMGGTYSDELDHKVSLELSGSNLPENLQIEPLVKGTKNTATDALENSLARDVAAGRKSLFQAQSELARIKSQPPEEGVKSSLWERFKGAVAHTITNIPNEINEGITAVLPNVKNIETGITTGDWKPFLDNLKGQTNLYKTNEDGKTQYQMVANKKVPKLDVEKLSSLVIGFVGGEQGEAKNLAKEFADQEAKKGITKISEKAPENIREVKYTTTPTGSALQKELGDKTLGDEHKLVEGKSFDTVATKGEKTLVDEYKTRFGNEINTDNARELFDEYNKDRTKSAAVHEPSSYIKNKVYDDLIETNKGKGNNTVLFTSGGTGAGKTTAIRELGIKESPYSIVYDSNLNTLDSSIDKVQKALGNNYKIDLMYVFNDIKSSLNNAFDRAESQRATMGTGRTVPLSEHIKTHMGSQDVVEQLMEKYKDNPNVNISMIDNSHGFGKTIIVPRNARLDFIDEIRHNKTYEEIYKDLQQHTKEQLAQGKISKETATGFGVSETRGRSGPTPSRQLESKRQEGAANQLENGKISNSKDSHTHRQPQDRSIDQSLQKKILSGKRSLQPEQSSLKNHNTLLDKGENLSKEESHTQQQKSQPQPQSLLEKGSLLEVQQRLTHSYADTISKLDKSQGLNVDTLEIDQKSKDLINKTVGEIKPQIEKKIGQALSNKEAIEFANESSKVLEKSIGREKTLEWEAGLLNLRQRMSKAAEDGRVDQNFIDDLIALKSHSTDIGRKLQSFSIGAEPKNNLSQQAIIDAVLKTTTDFDKVIKEAENVNFKDLNQATDFYRKFIKPKLPEWVDLVRYNSMLSSPKTHLVNAFSNLLNTSIVAPIEKALSGGLDFLGSSLTGKERTMFAGEGGAYAKAYFKNVKEATKRFSDVLSGKRASSDIDMRSIPIAASGKTGKVVTTLSYPMRLLEASDQFFTALTEGAEKSALEYRKSKGVEVGNIESKAQEGAAYRLYRQELHAEEQGHVLDAIDSLTAAIQSLRNNKNPIVSTIAKLTVPFLRTPMNIFKQGLEYSPAGFTTVINAKNKTEQISKAILGSSIFAAAGMFLVSNRITAEEPVAAKDKQLFRQAGKQAYSIKIGNEWVSYQKLPPVIAFPFAFVSILDGLVKDKKIDDSTFDLILRGLSRGGKFLSDQSYAKSIGDLVGALQGDESKGSSLLSNYPQQLIPYLSLSNWVARMVDDSQRKIDSQASFIDQQMQLLMMKIPGASFNVPARLDTEGNPIKTQNVANAFSPVNLSEENKKFADFLEEGETSKKAFKEAADAKVKEINDFRPTYDKIQELKTNGKTDEATKMLEDLTDDDYEKYKKIKQSESTRQTLVAENKMVTTVQKVQQLIKDNKQDEAHNLVDGLSDEDYRIYKLTKDKLGIK